MTTRSSGKHNVMASQRRFSRRCFLAGLKENLQKRRAPEQNPKVKAIFHFARGQADQQFLFGKGTVAVGVFEGDGNYRYCCWFHQNLIRIVFYGNFPVFLFMETRSEIATLTGVASGKAQYSTGLKQTVLIGDFGVGGKAMLFFNVSCPIVKTQPNPTYSVFTVCNPKNKNIETKGYSVHMFSLRKEDRIYTATRFLVTFDHAQKKLNSERHYVSSNQIAGGHDRISEPSTGS